MAANTPMLVMPSFYPEGDTTAEGNLHYILAEGKEHNDDAARAYLYNVLKLAYPE